METRRRDMKALKEILENASIAEQSCVKPTVIVSVEEDSTLAKR